ncbi:MAG TPA: VWA domain-containing protein [Pyrinomonadaceae bacterium]|nr:VWA domain-containing protein [Pyrinomonadaceae bacterium]
MKRSLALIIILGAVALSAFGQTTTSGRPRVAATPAPPVLGNDPTLGTTRQDAGPPVLRGGNSRPSAQPTPTPAADDPNEVIKVETNLVTMPVSVLDRDGRFISGLQQRDFKIFENGTEQKIDYFQSVEQPFTVVLLIDVSPSTQFRIDEIQNAAITFIDQLRPSDRVMVISFDDNVHVLTPATNDRNRLRNAIRQVEFGDGTSLYDAVSYAIDNELRHIEGRKAVVLFSDGVDTTSRRATYDSTLRDTEELDALFYTIRYDTSADMGGGWGGNSRGGGGGGYPRGGSNRRVSMADILGAIITGGNVGGNRRGGGWGRGGGNGSGAEYERGKRYLEGLATNSGGRNFEAQSMYNIDAAFQGIAEELRQQYSVGYYPDKVGQLGDRKQIKIRVMRTNVVVRAKNSYIVGQTNRNIAGK